VVFLETLAEKPDRFEYEGIAASNLESTNSSIEQNCNEQLVDNFINKDSLHLVPRSKNEWSYTSTPPIHLHGVVLS